jgi:hypothetical protein
MANPIIVGLPNQLIILQIMDIGWILRYTLQTKREKTLNNQVVQVKDVRKNPPLDLSQQYADQKSLL